MLSVSIYPLIVAVAMGGVSGIDSQPGFGRIDGFELRDYRGVTHTLSEWRDKTAIVIVFLGVDCPLNKLYAPRLVEISQKFGSRGTTVVGIDSNASDSLTAIADFARMHCIPFPILKDSEAIVANRFGAQRTPEVFLLDRERRIRYRGRIDDQYTIGSKRSAPTRSDLILALEEVLVDETVSQPITSAAGCRIDRSSTGASGGTVTYTKDIAPLLQKHCLACHRPKQSAPFSLTTYRKAAALSLTILEVIEKGQMPPWHANREYGHFANDPGLTDRDKKLVRDWVHASCPEGKLADLPAPTNYPEGWRIPSPDLIIPIPQPFTVPAEGVIEYQYFEVDPGFTEDKWVQAVEIRPGNKAVVHHALVELRPPGMSKSALVGDLGSCLLATTTLGTPPLVLQDGMAKRIPAGWKFVIVVHYTPVGSVQIDRTEVGLVFADPRVVKKEVATRLISDDDLNIPPHANDYRVEKTDRCLQDVLLLAMFPHMHLRGKSFRYEAFYPNGTTEILLDVPRYDFHWQNRYVLTEPKRLPAGTTVRCVAHYDNSADNLANPDPNATVRAGNQSWDEMFNGYYEIALADQDLTRPPFLFQVLSQKARRFWSQSSALSFAGGCIVFLFCNRLRKNRFRF